MDYDVATVIFDKITRGALFKPQTVVLWIVIIF